MKIAHVLAALAVAFVLASAPAEAAISKSSRSCSPFKNSLVRVTAAVGAGVGALVGYPVSPATGWAGAGIGAALGGGVGCVISKAKR